MIDRDSYYDQLTGYIHTNPVKAKIVTDPSKYIWSSYNSYIYGSSAYADIDRVRECIGHELKRHKEFVKISDNCEDPAKEVRAGFILGSEEFVNDKLALLHDMVNSKDFSHKRAVKGIIKPEHIIGAVSKHFGISQDEIIKSVKRPMTAKKIAIYLLQLKTGLTNSDIGKMFSMNASAVSKAARNFEKDMLGDPKLSKKVDEIVSTFEV